MVWKKPNLVLNTKLLLRLMWNPNDAFPEMAGSFLVPLLIMSAVGIILELTNQPFLEQVALHNMPEGMDPEQLQNSMKLLRLSHSFRIVVLPFLLLLKWFFAAGLIFLILQLAGGSMPFRQCFSLVAFSSIFLCLESCMTTLILVLRGIEQIKTPLDLFPALGLNIFLPHSSIVFYSLLQNVNILELWYLTVLILGVAYFNHFSNKKAAFVVTPVWLFFVLLSTSVTAIGSLLH